MNCIHGMTPEWCSICHPAPKIPSKEKAPRGRPSGGKYTEKVPSKSGGTTYRYKDTRRNRKNVKVYGRVRHPWTGTPSPVCEECGLHLAVNCCSGASIAC